MWLWIGASTVTLWHCLSQICLAGSVITDHNIKSSCRSEQSLYSCAILLALPRHTLLFICRALDWLCLEQWRSTCLPLCWGRPIFWPCRFITGCLGIMQIMPRVWWLWMHSMKPPRPLTLARKSFHNWIQASSYLDQPTMAYKENSGHHEWVWEPYQKHRQQWCIMT